MSTQGDREGFVSASPGIRRREEVLRRAGERADERKADRRKRTVERKAGRARERGRAPGGTLKRTNSLTSKGFTPASAEQKDKVSRFGPRMLDQGYPDEIQKTDPAHIVPRKLGGCDHGDCIVPLPRRLHKLYDEGKLDILPHLTLEEQAHAVLHLGILGALKQTTGDDYVPVVTRVAS